jgi:hypothetical protein
MVGSQFHCLIIGDRSMVSYDTARLANLYRTHLAPKTQIKALETQLVSFIRLHLTEQTLHFGRSDAHFSLLY